MVNSLKLVQRAELWDEQNENIVEKLYVDHLPNDGLLREIIQDDTVFLVGKKTGESTIFTRAQEYSRISKSEISAYVDVKTMYGKSQVKELNEDSDYCKTLLCNCFIKSSNKRLIKRSE